MYSNVFYGLLFIQDVSPPWIKIITFCVGDTTPRPSIIQIAVDCKRCHLAGFGRWLRRCSTNNLGTSCKRRDCDLADFDCHVKIKILAGKRKARGLLIKNSEDFTPFSSSPLIHNDYLIGIRFHSSVDTLGSIEHGEQAWSSCDNTMLVLIEDIIQIIIYPNKLSFPPLSWSIKEIQVLVPFFPGFWVPSSKPTLCCIKTHLLSSSAATHHTAIIIVVTFIWKAWMVKAEIMAKFMHNQLKTTICSSGIVLIIASLSC